MARVSAQTGIAPQLLMELDGHVWTALVDAVDTRWTQVEEMLTFQAELLHELIRYHSTRPLPPLRLPRPAHVMAAPPGLTPPEQLAAFVAGMGAFRGV
jgi:hypothetical protein